MRHTENQVKDLLTFARGGHFEPATVNLSNLVGEVEDNVEPLLQDAGATLNVVDETNGKAFVKGNNDALAGALGNLIENAIRHGGEQVSIDLTLMPVEDGYCVRIEDDGVGIGEDIRQEIFNPCLRSITSTKLPASIKDS